MIKETDLIYINGTYVPFKDSRVSILDRGFLYGDGVYEAFRVYNKKAKLLAYHYERLRESAENLSLACPISLNELSECVNKLCTDNDLIDAYIRVNLTRGVGLPGFNKNVTTKENIIVFSIPFTSLDEKYFASGIKSFIAKTKRLSAVENFQIKALGNVQSILAKNEAKNLGCLEIIMLNQYGFVCEGSSSNIFWFKDKTLYTPSVSTGLLDGITRRTIIQLAKKNSYNVEEGKFLIEELLNADEAFFSSTSLEVMPIIEVGELLIGFGSVGLDTQNLLSIFRNYCKT